MTHTVDWHGQLFEQLDWHWQTSARPRLDGLTDEEYRWEPVPGLLERPATWHRLGADRGRSRPVHVRLRRARARPRAGDHHRVAAGPPDGGVLRARTASHFGGPPYDAMTYAYPGDAATALGDSTRPTRRGATGSARSTPKRWPARSARRRGGSTRARWPRWCSTSIAKRSITWPRSPCCATSSPTADERTDRRSGHPRSRYRERE